MITKSMLKEISNSCQLEKTFKNWLGAFQKCFEETNEILGKCRDASNWELCRELHMGIKYRT